MTATVNGKVFRGVLFAPVSVKNFDSEYQPLICAKYPSLYAA